ncbi:acylphosphatase [Candidatus Daviesbacteria bacterium RIFCSPLOWO2_01_FULL_43_38]|uniref:acylphosphatase n=3 Tax=Candidatus Daviesiibacteriota TaxID=1752718 RepID=A0A1F5K4S7_9BACT|nr:MAG: Acylphosphatase [Candidatus Daviesbacteria bacterium GW2011_GWA1_42_6]KKS69396.1 MAG: Acylphosphatase [Candidatus Daviesbacteria bacterium GW2011_GWA2_42_7]OGE20020.1 MAG: acylphosphatase [Candidatus Daviesbacteria bacterium RIFCSPHIGHO2_01_FULL_43_17]OGE35770.1 MAG: acylphosphatase [Candidatus Daviesbacteria bacterium RIFCSPHIGHO2_12_FULL_43_11]OGE63455.1 MAG: acylphosphatase [Candidatus Daviesbacteria bacterium RIFCSPLOWO2_01_FULL_43_38]OGE69681.1 MAG: acylphosphatase [Candidatus Dav
MLKHINIKIYGNVQGVGFRQAIKAKADSLNITGYTRNIPNGSVYVESEGEEGNLNKLVEWCNDGPETAEVDSVKVEDGQIKEFDDFKAL